MRLMHGGAFIAALTSVLLLSSSSMARPGSSWAYFGGGWEYTAMTYDSAVKPYLPHDLSGGFDVHVGGRAGNYFAAELGYLNLSDSRTSWADQQPFHSTMAVSGPVLDMYGYLPAGDGGLSLLATAGLTYLHAKSNLVLDGVATSTAKASLGYRVGVGFEWRPSEHVGFRFVARYQPVYLDKVAHGSATFGETVDFYL
ncbi:MAG: outer membrane beta-barrel protein [Alphaproteobacteria bacterium]|nr:outer membrane beta-barrel protein [Alphaproteobacteria bacterium]